MDIKFNRYSIWSKSVRDKTNYLKIKRLVLKTELDIPLNWCFNPFIEGTPLHYALRYHDIENESEECFYYYSPYKTKYDETLGVSDFLCSLYEQDRGFFQSFLNFLLNEIKRRFRDSKIYILDNELGTLGYLYDDEVLKTLSGSPFIEQKISSVIAEKLQKINPQLIEMRDGAIESLLSNKPDKTRHVASSSRALINTLLKDLVPEIEEKSDESAIKSRIKKLFGSSESTMEVIDSTTKLIQALNKAQSKGDHSSIDNEQAFFIFELTEKLVYFILTYKELNK